MSTLRKFQKGVGKVVSTQTIQKGAGRMKDGTMGALNGIKDGLSQSKEFQRSDSGHFHDSDDDDQDLRMSLTINDKTKTNVLMAGFSIRPGDLDGNATDASDDLYLDNLEPVAESHTDEKGLKDDDDDSTGAIVKRKKKVKKIKYRKAGGNDSDGSDTKSAKSYKSSKSGKSRRKKKVKRSDLSVGSKKKKGGGGVSPTNPNRRESGASLKSETSSVRRRRKKKIPEKAPSSDDDSEKNDTLSPLASPNETNPVLQTRSKSPRSPKKMIAPPIAPVSPLSPNEHPIKQELKRFSDLWKTQAGENERESIRVSTVLGLRNGSLNDSMKPEVDPYENDVLESKLRSTEQKLIDSEAKVEELIVKKTDIQNELNEEQLRNDELGRRLLYLEDRVEELEVEKEQLEAQPRVGEQQADPIELFELQQDLNQLKTDMSLKEEQHAEALHSKDERIKELEDKLEATESGKPQQRESITSLHSMHSTIGTASDARTQGLLLRSNAKIQEQEAEIRELRQKLQELANVEIVEQKDEEIKNLGVQMSDLETQMKGMEEDHENALKQKDETIQFFQTQLVEMQKKMPKPAAYTRRENVGEEGTMTLGGGEGSEEEGGGLWGAISAASPGWLGGRQAVDRRAARGAPHSPKL